MQYEILVVIAPHILLRGPVSATLAALPADVRKVADHFQGQGWALSGGGPCSRGARLEFRRPRIHPVPPRQ